MMNDQISIMPVLFLFFICGVLGFAVPTGSRASVDNHLYAELLEKYVDNGLVDYQGFKNSAACSRAPGKRELSG